MTIKQLEKLIKENNISYTPNRAQSVARQRQQALDALRKNGVQIEKRPMAIRSAV